MKFWNVSSGECLQNFEGFAEAVKGVAFSSTTSWIASASHDMTVKVRDTASSKDVLTVESHEDMVNLVVFAPDSRRLASASYDWMVKVWDTGSGKCLHTLKGHQDAVSLAIFSSDSKMLASASYEGMVKIWDADTGACLHMLSDEAVDSLAFSTDSTRFASVSLDSTIRIWNTDTGNCILTLKGESDDVDVVTLPPNSTVLSWPRVEFSDNVQETESSGGAADAESIAVSCNSLNCGGAASSHNSDFIQIMGPQDSEDTARAISFSPDCTRFASALEDGSISIWDTGSGDRLHQIEGNSGPVRSIAFSPDLIRLAAAFFNNTVKIWDIESGDCLQTLSLVGTPTNMSFDNASMSLHTELGVVPLDSTTGSLDAPVLADDSGPILRTWALSSDGNWIMHGSENLLWLPL